MQRIRQIAEKKNISIRALAKNSEITEQQLQLIIRTGKTRIDTLQKIANALQVPIWELFDEWPLSINQQNGNVLIGGDNNGHVHTLTECEKEIEYLKELLKAKDETIEILKTKFR